MRESTSVLSIDRSSMLEVRKKLEIVPSLNREMLISCAETAQLICGFVIEYAKCRFSHDLAQLKLATDYENKDSDQLRSNFAAD